MANTFLAQTEKLWSESDVRERKREGALGSEREASAANRRRCTSFFIILQSRKGGSLCRPADAMSEAIRAAMENSTAEARGISPETDLGFLWDFWYPALLSREIRGRNLQKATLLEVPLVLGRTTDRGAFAMRDSCP